MLRFLGIGKEQIFLPSFDIVQFPNPRQRTFLLKRKILLFRSWSDGKYLTWKIHQWPYYSDLGFHICYAHISNSGIQSLCFEERKLSKLDFLWRVLFDVNIVNMFAKIEKCFWEQNTIESCFKTERKLHSNYELDHESTIINEVIK